MIKPFLTAIKSELLCLIAGGLLTLAFAPFHIWLFAFICPAVLLWHWQTASAKRSFTQGLCFGIGLFGSGISWVFISIYNYGGTSLLVACLITALFVLALALLIAINGLLLGFYRQANAYKCLCLFPVSWVCFEWLRSTLFTGFPWLLLGYTQMSNSLAGYAPVLSVYGVSLMTLILAGIMVLWLRKQSLQYSLPLAILVCLLGYGLHLIHWTQPAGKAQTVSLIQGDIPVSIKWVPGAAEQIANTYVDLTNSHWQDLVIWPENALPVFPEIAQPFLNYLSDLAKQHHSAILLGMPFDAANPTRYFNGALVIGEGQGHYYKRHLVPFGEYIPWQQQLGSLLQFLDIPMSGFNKGPEVQSPITAHGIPVALFICYEIAYAEEVRSYLNQAQLIITISDDSWFGHSLGAEQQAEIAQMRALETGRYVLSGSNDGITSIIAPDGRVLAKAPRYVQTVLTGSVYPMTGSTPWLRFGLWPLLAIALAMVLLPLFKRRRLPTEMPLAE
jgi:apolipoprotein N-acyltransferase